MGRCGIQKKWTFWTLKVDFLDLTLLTLLKKKKTFWFTLWLKVDLLADLGVHRTPSTPLATGLINSTHKIVHDKNFCKFKQAFIFC